MFKNTKNKSVYEKLEEKLNCSMNESENESENGSTPKVIDFDEEDYNFDKNEARKSLSEIRKQNVQLLSEQSSKYSGEIISRKSIGNDSDDDFNATMEDLASCEKSERSRENSFSWEDNDVTDSVDDELPDGNIVSAKNSKLEIEKGLCVQNELAIWEKLLEIRIHSQKILNKANSLPCPRDFNKLFFEKERREIVENATRNTEGLLEKLIEVQVTLANQFSDIKKLELCARKRSHPELNMKNSSKRFALAIKSNFEKFRPYRNTILLKWEDRTKLLASGTGKRKHLSEEFDIVQKVDNLLTKRDDHIAKSRKLKGTYTLFGHKCSNLEDQTDIKEEISSPNIYDDTDFYHSQLRELIEFKSDVSSNAYDVTKQFAELQKLRQKMKKKVDTRASKGRKMRYVIHHKLINFMAPNNTTEWTEESKNELYRSLFIT